VIPLLAVGETGALVLGAADVGMTDAGTGWLAATLALPVGSLTAFP
jgi:hypothetical protein